MTKCNPISIALEPIVNSTWILNQRGFIHFTYLELKQMYSSSEQSVLLKYFEGKTVLNDKNWCTMSLKIMKEKKKNIQTSTCNVALTFLFFVVFSINCQFYRSFSSSSDIQSFFKHFHSNRCMETYIQRYGELLKYALDLVWHLQVSEPVETTCSVVTLSLLQPSTILLQSVSCFTFNNIHCF